MNHAFALSDILQIENCEEILEFQCPGTGIPIWTTIRVLFFRLIISDLFYGVPIGGGANNGSVTKFSHATIIGRSFAHNVLQMNRLKQACPIIIMATGVRLIQREGFYFNALSDYFVEATQIRTLAIEDIFDSKWPFPRYKKEILLHTPLRVQGVLSGKLRMNDFRLMAWQLVDMVSQRAKKIIDWDIGENRKQWLKEKCISGSASLLPRYKKYQKIFKKTEAKLLIKEEACYGGSDNAAAILAARSLGVVTAEYQHGAISMGHDAYNYAPGILNSSEFRKIIPDYFLTYGSWWGEQINAPIKRIAVGNPHRTEVLGASSSLISQSRQVLVLGDGIETSAYLKLCENLAAVLGMDYRVIFRPHPLERASVWDKYPDGLVNAVRIDVNQDIYSSFRDAGAVVSEVSTGLFEAIGLVSKVFIWNTPKARFAYPVHPFQGFADADELAGLVLDSSAGRVTKQQMDSIWAPNWQRNYLDFIEQVVRP